MCRLGALSPSLLPLWLGPDPRFLPLTASVRELCIVATVAKRTMNKFFVFIGIDGRVGTSLRLFDAAEWEVS